MHCLESTEPIFTQCNIKLFTAQRLISALYAKPFMKLAPSESYHIDYQLTWYAQGWNWLCCKAVGGGTRLVG